MSATATETTVAKSAGQQWADEILAAQPRSYQELSNEEPLKAGERLGCKDKTRINVKYTAGVLPSFAVVGAEALLQIDRQELSLNANIGTVKRGVTFEDKARRKSACAQFLRANGFPIEETVEHAAAMIDYGT